MKTLFLLLCLGCNMAFAFDPAGPPQKRTLEWTTNHLMHSTLPLVELDGVTLEDAAAVAGRIEIPEAYTVRVRIPADESIRVKKITVKAKEITQLALIAAIAEQSGLDVMITPGTVILLPRTKTGGQGADKPATRSESNPE